MTVTLPKTGDTTLTSLIIVNYKTANTTLLNATKAMDLAKKSLWDTWDRIKKKNEAGREPSAALIAKETENETALVNKKIAVGAAKTSFDAKIVSVKNRIEANNDMLKDAADLKQDTGADIADINTEITVKKHEKQEKQHKIQAETDELDSAAITALQNEVNAIDVSLNEMNVRRSIMTGDIEIIENFIKSIKHEQNNLKAILVSQPVPTKIHKKNHKKEQESDSESVSDSDTDSDSGSDTDSDTESESESDSKCKKSKGKNSKCKKDKKSDDTGCALDLQKNLFESNKISQLLGLLNFNKSQVIPEKGFVSILILCLNVVNMNSKQIISSMPDGVAKTELVKLQKSIKENLVLLNNL